MATFKWSEVNLGIYGYDRFGQYQEVQRTPTSLVLAYDPANGPLDPAAQAARITLTFSGYSAVLVETGPRAGSFQVVGGVLTGITYAAGDGAVLLDITRIAVIDAMNDHGAIFTSAPVTKYGSLLKKCGARYCTT